MFVSRSSHRVAAAASLVTRHTRATPRLFASVATVPKDKAPRKDGDRIVLEEDGAGKPIREPILVAKVNGIFYALDATCPHMKKSMEKGKIFTDKGPEPEIRCRIHNTRFNMKTGVCTQWVTGLLGYENNMVGGLAQKVGGEKQDVQAYRVITNDDGSLTIDNDLSETSAAAKRAY